MQFSFSKLPLVAALGLHLWGCTTGVQTIKLADTDASSRQWDLNYAVSHRVTLNAAYTRFDGDTAFHMAPASLLSEAGRLGKAIHQAGQSAFANAGVNVDMRTEQLRLNLLYGLRQGEKLSFKIGAGIRQSDDSLVMRRANQRLTASQTSTSGIVNFTGEWRFIPRLALRYEYNEALGDNAPDSFIGLRAFR